MLRDVRMQLSREEEGEDVVVEVLPLREVLHLKGAEEEEGINCPYNAASPYFNTTTLWCLELQGISFSFHGDRVLGIVLSKRSLLCIFTLFRKSKNSISRTEKNCSCWDSH